MMVHRVRPRHAEDGDGENDHRIAICASVMRIKMRSTVFPKYPRDQADGRTEDEHADGADRADEERVAQPDKRADQ